MPDRFTKLRDNFFSAAANGRNASEAPTAGLMELRDKTCYLLEELPQGKIYTSLLKMMCSRDTMRGRQLHKGMQAVDVIGKLFINANAPPELGEEGAVWDRAVYIPWDTRYVTNTEAVDIANYRLPSNNTKKEYLVSLHSAFMTVCLKELNRFLNLPGNMDSNGLLVTDLVMPPCVQHLVNQEKERAFPLKMFVKTYIKESSTKDDCPHIETNKFFHAYCGFIRSRNLRSNESLDDITSKLVRVGLICEEYKGQQMIMNSKMTEAGERLADREAINMRVDVGDGPLAQAFKRQRVIAPQPAVEEDEHPFFMQANETDFNDEVNGMWEDERKELEEEKSEPHVRDMHCIMKGCKGQHIM